MLNWANQFNICCFLDNHNYDSLHHQVECLLGAGAIAELSCSSGSAFTELRSFAAQHEDWIFGHFGYGLTAETISSPHQNLHEHLYTDHIGFDDLKFFVPRVVIELTTTEIRIGTLDNSASIIYREIKDASKSPEQRPAGFPAPETRVQQRMSREEYLQTIRQLQAHIHRGDCYEINFCQEFFVQSVAIDPLQTYLRLSEASPNPFSAFYRMGKNHLLCASPERYLRKSGTKIISQPIKGTLRRKDASPDQLLASEKDKSENVMVVDLVRNDLSMVCREGSVKVDELFGIYTFPHVYQMISTISGELQESADWLAAIQASFPMGSMTGAPKRKVTELIGQYERSRRGLFSGAVGYVTPARDFDFNVVIRSILYNSDSGYLSFPAGSGITYYSDAESEYDECVLKAEAIRKILEQH